MNLGKDQRLLALDRLLKSDRPKSAIETAAIQRQVNDLRTGHERGLVWREDEAVRAVKFCGLLKHWKDPFAGKPFVPEPWQEECLLAPLFGWYREDGLRRFNLGYVEIPRKNGKTSLAACVGLQGLLADQEQGAEVYAAATKRDQARILFSDAKQFLRRSTLFNRVKVFQHSISFPPLNGSFQALSSDTNSLHGLNISRAIVDEIHSHKTRDLWDVLLTSTGSRVNPLILGITTAGHNRSSICWELHEYTRSILEGHVADESFFGFVSCAEPDDDIADPATWWKANPNLGVSVRHKKLQDESARAAELPSYENTFRRLHLNQWTEQAKRWIQMTAWDNCRRDFDLSDLVGRECWAALDLASTRDVNALVLLFPEGDGFIVLAWFWIPEDHRTERDGQDRRQVMNWASQGLVKKTPGNTTDYREIERDIQAIAKQFRILGLAYDPWNANHIALNLQDEGLPMVEFRQTLGNFAAPTKELEKLVVSGNLQHDGNPVLRWMASNVCVKSDSSGNIRPDKANSADKIDGIVALIMALALSMQGGGTGPSVYETRGILSV